MSETSRPARDSWWRTAPVLTIAVLALIISTAGGAYAVGKNSIGTKQLKKNAVTSIKIKNSSIQSSDVKNNSLSGADIKDGGVSGADVQDGSLTANDFAPGQLAPIPAASSRVYFAKVGADGTLTASSAGVVSASREPGKTGIYDVTLAFDATRCAATATSSDSTVSASAEAGGGAGGFVTTRSLDGGLLVNSDFSLTIVC